MISADVLLRLREALLARRVAAGHWEGHLSSSALATATAVTALATARRAGLHVPDAGRLVHEGIGWLVASRNADGGWGDTTCSVSNISTTALVWAALTFESAADVEAAAAGAEKWIARAAGSAAPEHLASALAARYGKDRTFSVPILTMCAIAGRLGPPATAWQLIPQLPFELALFPRRFFGALRLPVVSYALPALISMGLARHRRGRGIPLVSSLRERAAERVLRVLDGLQPAPGGFLEAVPLTSFVAMSLIAAGERNHPCVARGLGFLSRAVRPDGSWPIDSNLATWITTLSVNALASGGPSAAIPESDRDRIRDWLLGQQWTAEHPYTGAAPGGWAWTDLPGGVPDADDTAGALVALAHLDRDEPRVRRAAVAGARWLLDLQNRDGGIPTFCRGWGTLPFDRSATDLTAHALRAWTAWIDTWDPPLQARARGAIRRAVRFLARAQREDGAFVPLWFGSQYAPEEENPVFGTSRVLRGLAAAAVFDGGAAQTVSRRAEAWLLAAQHPDGGWGADRNAPASIEETAVAISALSECAGDWRQDRQGAVRRGVEWLAQATADFSCFPPSPIGLYFARLWYFETLYPLVFSIDAVSSASYAIVTRDPAELADPNGS
ncbi:MAG TPA: prenyltransferase/squalene oxidase repeat-containing protein [Vicinamibacterales bacterium]|nr:prenyltransferase/squalene oxidase repeat-containing protein [Vicinamibacterales bacterium]